MQLYFDANKLLSGFLVQVLKKQFPEHTLHCRVE